MRTHSRVLYLATLLALAGAGPVSALADSEPGVIITTSDTWQFSASIYGWIAGVGGTAHFPVAGTSTDFKVDASTLLDHVELAAAGTFDLHRGNWGAFTDVMYMDLGGGKSNTRDFTLGNIAIRASTTADLHLGVKSWIWTIAGEYRVAADSAWTVDLLAGARYLDMTQTLNWSFTGALGPLPPADRTGSSESGPQIWTGIIGAKGRYAFGAGGKWSVPFYLDAGMGDSEYTYQAALGLGYAFQWGEVTALWRYLDYSPESSNRLGDFYFSGPLIGATFRW